MKKKKKITLKIEGKDLDAFLGRLARERYLSDNPHGFRKKTTKTKNARKYTRKGKGGKNAPLFYLG